MNTIITPKYEILDETYEGKKLVSFNYCHMLFTVDKDSDGNEFVILPNPYVMHFQFPMEKSKNMFYHNPDGEKQKLEVVKNNFADTIHGKSV